MKEKLIKEEVFSKIEDKNISNNLGNSAIWKQAKHKEDVTESDGEGYLYHMLFDGLTPVGCTSHKKFKV